MLQYYKYKDNASKIRNTIIFVFCILVLWLTYVISNEKKWTSISRVRHLYQNIWVGKSLEHFCVNKLAKQNPYLVRQHKNCSQVLHSNRTHLF